MIKIHTNKTTPINYLRNDNILITYKKLQVYYTLLYLNFLFVCNFSFENALRVVVRHTEIMSMLWRHALSEKLEKLCNWYVLKRILVKF